MASIEEGVEAREEVDEPLEGGRRTKGGWRDVRLSPESGHGPDSGRRDFERWLEGGGRRVETRRRDSEGSSEGGRRGVGDGRVEGGRRDSGGSWESRRRSGADGRLQGSPRRDWRIEEGFGDGREKEYERRESIERRKRGGRSEGEKLRRESKEGGKGGGRGRGRERRESLEEERKGVGARERRESLEERRRGSKGKEGERRGSVEEGGRRREGSRDIEGNRRDSEERRRGESREEETDHAVRRDQERIESKNWRKREDSRDGGKERRRERSEGEGTESTLSKSATILVDEAETHRDRVPLNTPWTFWLDKSSKGFTQADYEAALREIYTVTTVEGFWRVYNNIPTVAELQSSCSYHLMRRRVRPLWEDEENQDGGTWRLKCPKADADRVWKEMLLACIGEQMSPHLHPDDELIGVTIAVRDRDDLVQIWNRESSLADEEKILKVIQSFVPDVEFLASFYKPHQTHHAFQRGSNQPRSSTPTAAATAASSSGTAAAAAAVASFPVASLPRQIPPPGFRPLGPRAPPSEPIRISASSAGRTSGWASSTSGEATSGPRVSSLPMNIIGAREGAGGGGGWGTQGSAGSGALDSSPFAHPPPLMGTSPMLPTLMGTSPLHPPTAMGTSPLLPPGCSPHLPPPNWIKSHTQERQSSSFDQRDLWSGKRERDFFSDTPPPRHDDFSRGPRRDSGAREAIELEDDAVLAVGSPPSSSLPPAFNQPPPPFGSSPGGSGFVGSPRRAPPGFGTSPSSPPFDAPPLMGVAPAGFVAAAAPSPLMPPPPLPPGVDLSKPPPGFSS